MINKLVFGIICLVISILYFTISHMIEKQRDRKWDLEHKKKFT